MRQFLSIVMLAVLSIGLLHAQGEKELLKAQKYEAMGERQWPNALKYYRKAADKGNLEALFKVANNDLAGEKPCEQVKTLEILQRLDDADAFRLAKAYRRCGDTVKYIRYLQKAAAEDNAKALEQLGDAYWCGKGVERDRFEAIVCYKAAELYSTGAERLRLQEKFANFYELREVISQNDENNNPANESAIDTSSLPEKEKESDATDENNFIDRNEVMPEYFGGIEQLMKFLQDEVFYPESAMAQGISGTNLVEFVVEKDGCVTNAKVKVALYPVCDEESVRAVMAMPPWKPGGSNGKLVRCFFQVPITYTR